MTIVYRHSWSGGGMSNDESHTHTHTHIHTQEIKENKKHSGAEQY